jgi:hypothetical protein
MAAATSSETVRGSYIERKNKSGMNFDQKHILRLRKSKTKYVVDGAFSGAGWAAGATFRKHADFNVNVRVRINVKQSLCGGRTGNSIKCSHWIKSFRNATRGTHDTKKSSICWPVNLIY